VAQNLAMRASMAMAGTEGADARSEFAADSSGTLDSLYMHSTAEEEALASPGMELRDMMTPPPKSGHLIWEVALKGVCCAMMEATMAGEGGAAG
jgi:hypothetical protein